MDADTVIRATARFVADYPRTIAAIMPDKAAIIAGDVRIDFRSFARRVAGIGATLRARGIRPGDRIGYVGQNSHFVVEALFGVLAARAVFTPINWRLAQGEMETLIADSRLALLLCDSGYADRFGDWAAANPTIPLVVVDGADGLADWYDTPAPADGFADLDDDDVIFQLYTSGTTGAPKGVLLTNRNARAQRASEDETAASFTWQAGDVIAAAAPMFNIGGINWALMGLSRGTTCVVLQAFRPPVLLDAVATHGVTLLFAVPAIIDDLVTLQIEKGFDVSSLRLIHYGAAPIAPHRLARALGVFDCGFVQHYGSTEAGGSKFILLPEDHLTGDPAILESCGRQMPGVAVRIVSDDGVALGTGEAGELQLRYESIARDYWRQGEVSPIPLDDGWFPTGDIGAIDAHGYFRVIARKKDVIVSGGSNVYPAEVESALLALDGVVECAVIGVPDDKWGEAVKAVVVVSPGTAFDPAETQRTLRSAIADYKIPKSFDLIDALPRLPIGKVDKPALREPYWAGQSRRVG